MKRDFIKKFNQLLVDKNDEYLENIHQEYGLPTMFEIQKKMNEEGLEYTYGRGNTGKMMCENELLKDYFLKEQKVDFLNELMMSFIETNFKGYDFTKYIQDNPLSTPKEYKEHKEKLWYIVEMTSDIFLEKDLFPLDHKDFKHLTQNKNKALKNFSDVYILIKNNK